MLDIVDEGIHPGLIDVRIVAQVIFGIELIGWVSAFLPSTDNKMPERIHIYPPDVRIVEKIIFRVKSTAS
jgi:hypothetical protein